MHPTTPNPRNLKILKIFLWIVWAFNMALYAAFGNFAFTLGENLASSSSDRLFVGIYSALILFPGVFTGMAQLLVRDYYPDKELILRKRRLYTVLGIFQIVLATAVGVFGVFIFFTVVTDESASDAETHFVLATSIWAIAMMAASLINFAAAIIVFRTIRRIRRNFQARLLETFETL